ncbi:hypothetical protein BVY03_03675 [bacterium K02(2017)]|nr:hypothetical protein BVY03_03675 [bacterium K02(2017)]
MRYDETLGKTFECKFCPKEHQVLTEKLIYQDDALDLLVPTLNKYLSKDSLIAVIADTRTQKILGQEVIQILSKNKIKVISKIVPDINNHSPVCDEQTKNFLLNSIPDVQCLIAVGSGVINDLCKWVSFAKDIPYFSFATAASMNGYPSTNVAASVNGVKCLIQAKSPLVVFALPKIIQQAPFELTAAGLGDALAKPVSSADWKVNQFLFNDYYCSFIVDMVAELEKGYLENPAGIKSKDPDAIEALFKTLFYSGIAMSIAGTSAPASGGEHLLSHSLDMLAGRDKQEHDLHGRQVGLGTILSAALYDLILKQNKITWQPLNNEIDFPFWGDLAPEVNQHFQNKQARALLALEKLQQPQTWPELKNELAAFIKTPELIKTTLKSAGAAHLITDIGDYSLDSFTRIWQHSYQMRSRFTILDLAQMAGIMPHSASNLISQWLI